MPSMSGYWIDDGYVPGAKQGLCGHPGWPMAPCGPWPITQLSLPQAQCPGLLQPGTWACPDRFHMRVNPWQHLSGFGELSAPTAMCCLVLPRVDITGLMHWSLDGLCSPRQTFPRRVCTDFRRDGFFNPTERNLNLGAEEHWRGKETGRGNWSSKEWQEWRHSWAAYVFPHQAKKKDHLT